MGQNSLLDMGDVDLIYVLALLGVFVAVCLFITYLNYSVIEPLRKRRQINRRIRSNKKEQEFRSQIFKAYQESRSSPILSVMRRLTGWSKGENLQRQLLQADIYLSPGIFIGIVGIMGVGGILIGVLRIDLFGIGLNFGWVLGFLPILYMRWQKKRKTAKFEQQMPEAMEILARSLRAGHTLQATLELVAQEIPAPLGKEMRITYDEQKLGLSVTQALRRMGDRVASQDLRYFVTAVLIQSETGGNLAEILENIGTLIRERMKLKGKIQSLTAEGRFSALILTVLPLFAWFFLYLLNRKYAMVLLVNPYGKILSTVVIINIAIGAMLMKKMVEIKV
jgi:tight adherence protein B